MRLNAMFGVLTHFRKRPASTVASMLRVSRTGIALAGLASLAVGAGGMVFVIMLGPSIGSYYPIDRVRAGDLPLLASVIDEYHGENGRYPESLSDLLGLKDRKIYVRNVPKDPWGSSYVYRRVSDEYELYSVGQNGIDESQRGDDVILDDKEYECGTYGKNCDIDKWGVIAFASIAAAASGLAMAGVGFALSIAARFKSSSD